MTSPRSMYLAIGGHEIHVTEWGEAGWPVLVMWHGLARTGRDFDVLARRYAGRYRVLCPDTIGRGRSSWSRQPDRDYSLASYAGQAVQLLDQLGVGECQWIGTSMGGLIGIIAAAGSLRGRITRLVLNDIGPRINPESITRIRAYVAARPSFDTMVELEAFLRQVYAPFGRLGDEEWRHLAETSARRGDDGRWTLHYDPEVMRVFAAHPDDGHLWREWERVTCPVLVLRGENSDVLQPEVAEEMTRRGPLARLVTVAGCGHAPALNVAAQFAVLDDFLGFTSAVPS